MNRAVPLRTVYLFGSHARGEARADSDVDLCIVADGADHQIEATQRLRQAVWDIREKPALTLVPIAPSRLEEKQAIHDPFFETILREGVALAAED